MTAVQAGGKVKLIKFFAEGFILPAVPNIFQRVFFYIAKRTMGDLPADIVHIGVAVVQQRHTGAHLSVSTDKGHTFPDEFAVSGLPQHRLIIKIQLKVLLAHQTADAVSSLRDVQVEKGKPHSGQHTAF